MEELDEKRNPDWEELRRVEKESGGGFTVDFECKSVSDHTKPMMLLLSQLTHVFSLTHEATHPDPEHSRDLSILVPEHCAMCMVHGNQMKQCAARVTHVAQCYVNSEHRAALRGSNCINLSCEC